MHGMVVGRLCRGMSMYPCARACVCVCSYLRVCVIVSVAIVQFQCVHCR